MINKEQIEKYSRLSRQLIDDYVKKQSQMVLSGVTKRKTDELSFNRQAMEDKILLDLHAHVEADGSKLSDDEISCVYTIIKKELWGYGIIDDLIHDPDVSDIKLYGTGDIRIKQKGMRESSGICFASEKEYKGFVMRLLEKNKINLGTANAIQTFTDKSMGDVILRITAISGILTDSELPCIAIRKIPRNKADLAELKDKGMFDPPQRKMWEEKAEAPKDLIDLLSIMTESRGILFTGKGASGKTTLMNAMLQNIPHNESVMICQENSELFDNDHPDLLSVHVINNGADSKISYTLGDLTRAALLMDLDRVIVGEVKEGSEAAGLSKASMTGHKCWTSVHGENCRMAVDKMADYISQATGCHLRDSLKQLTGFEYVIHLRRFNIDEIIRIDGWDKKNDDLLIREVYPFRKASVQDKNWWEV